VPQSGQQEESESSVAWPVPAALIVLGIALRVAEFTEPSSLWGDETMLAINIASRSYGELTGPLYFGQTAPILYLWLERLVFELAGSHERVFRLVPFVGSVLSLPAFHLLADRVARGRTAVVALALVAASPVLVTYSGEGKPYSTDFLVSVLVLLAAERWTCRVPGRRGMVILAFAGCAALLASTPAILVLLAAVAAAAVRRVARGCGPSLPALGAAAVLWTALFAVQYLLVLGDVATNAYMQEFWERTLLSPGPGFAARVWEGMSAGVAPAGAALYPPLLVPLFILLAGCGLARLVVSRRADFAVLFALPLLLAFGAALLGRYALHPRLLLFAVPAVVLLVAMGVNAVAVWTAGRLPLMRPRFVAAAFVLPFVIVGASVLTARSPQYEAMAPIVAELEKRADPQAPVYVFARNTPAWLFYTTRWEQPDLEALDWVASRAGPGGVAHENGPSRGVRPVGEGADLAYRVGGRPVLVGVPSGSQVRARQGFVPARTDSGWAANEAARIAAAARPDVWLVLSTYGEAVLPECGEIVDSLRQRGLEVRAVARVGTTVLARATRPRVSPGVSTR
jgi:hypothetical protein